MRGLSEKAIWLVMFIQINNIGYFNYTRLESQTHKKREYLKPLITELRNIGLIDRHSCFNEDDNLIRGTVFSYYPHILAEFTEGLKSDPENYDRLIEGMRNEYSYQSWRGNTVSLARII